MALARAQLTSGGVISPNPSSITTASISPTSGATVYVLVTSQRSTGGQDPSTVAPNAGLTASWTKFLASATFNAGLSKTSVWRATGVTGSGTITITYPNTQSSIFWEVWEVTGNSASTPTNTTTGIGTTSPATLTLPSSPASTSFTFGGIGTYDVSATGITPGAQFTEIGESTGASGTGSDSGYAESECDPTSPGTTVDWTFTTRDWGAVAWEEVEAAVGGATWPGWVQSHGGWY